MWESECEKRGWELTDEEWEKVNRGEVHWDLSQKYLEELEELQDPSYGEYGLENYNPSDSYYKTSGKASKAKAIDSIDETIDRWKKEANEVEDEEKDFYITSGIPQDPMFSSESFSGGKENRKLEVDK